MAGYASYDGADATMITVNNDPGISCPNANWNGTSTNYCSGVTGDDTVAHEWGHAYTEYTHGLVYAWQPGALNESYSDIWGEIVDLVNGRGSDDAGTRTDGSCADAAHDPTGGPHGPDASYRWLSGEDDPAFGGAIRDMWSPQCHGDPGKVSDAVYHCASSDSGGVHTNSGVPNHAFALLVDGGTYNGQTISGIGLDKAAYIYWRAQSVYQGVASDFADHATSLAASCSDLTGNATLTGLSATGTPGAVIPAITAGDCAELAKVVTAVEFNTPPTQCGFTPAFVAAPALCAGQGTGAVESINSQDWESGIGSWTFDTHDIAIPGTFTNPDWTIVGSLPAGEAGDAMYVEDSINRGACTAADSVAGALNLDSPSILIPAGADIPRVAIDHYVAIESGWDGGNLKISVNGGAWTVVPNSAFEVNGYFAPGAINGGSNDNPLGGEEGWTGGGEGQVATGWGQSQINLIGIAAAGDTIQLRFDMGLDG
ncbi:MAG: M4 family metallopeptidase, partial [Methylococcales bacterium]|nr:M4 family metallopeptidase [Methylococcales bacterium]